MDRPARIAFLALLLTACGDDDGAANSPDAAVADAAATGADARPADAGAASPQEKGPYTAGITTFMATFAGDRVARVQVWYPTSAAPDCQSRYTIEAAAGTFQLTSALCAAIDGPVAPGPFPLLIYDHPGAPAGADMVRIAMAPLDELLATHGFIVVVALHSADATVRIKDLKILTDLMLARGASTSDIFAGKIDPDRIGTTGLSAGGATAFNFAAGRAEVSVAADPRVKAMVVYEPGPATNISLEDAGRLTVPYLIMGGSQFAGAEYAAKLYATTTKATQRVYVKVPNAVHLNFGTGMCWLIQQTREAALAAVPNIAEPLTTLTASNAAAAAAYQQWNMGQLQFAALGIGVGGGRNFCTRTGITSLRPLDANGDGLTDDPPFYTSDPMYTTGPAVPAEIVVPLVNLYTVAFFKVVLGGDERYKRFLTQGYATSQGSPAIVETSP